MNFLSVLYAKAGITVDGVTTLNNTATGLTPATNDNSTNIATTAFVKNQNYYPYPTGTTSQYVRGDGSLATFTQTGGGGSVSYYLNGSVSQGTIGGNAYYEMSKTAIIGTNADFNLNADGYIAQFVTDAGDPALLSIPGGNWNFEMFFSASSGGGSPSFYVELYKYDGTTLTLIASGSAAPEAITGGTSTDLYITALAVPTTTLTLTDRLAVRVYVNHSGRTITLHTQNGHLCQVITTFTTGLTALNGLTAQVQNFAVGAGGSDFNISSVTDTHTFNLPTASATKRGALSSIDWSAFDAKVDFGDLSATSPLSYNGSGVFSIAQSSTSTNGYVSSTDWNTFNNKIGGSGTANYIAKFTSGSVVGNSIIYDNGTNVGIGTTSPIGLSANTSSLSVNSTRTDLSGGIFFAANNTSKAGFYWGSEGLFNEVLSGSALWYLGGSERMRITSAGYLGIGTSNPLYRLESTTTALFGTTAYGVLNIAGDNPAYIKIKTNIPFSYGNQGYTVNIKGFQYGSAQTLDLQICWHQYIDLFTSPTITSKGSFAPVVRLARESGLVVIVLTWGQYWPKLYVESVHNYLNDGYANGWTWVDENVTGDKTVTLSYKNDFGDDFVKTAAGLVGIGTNNPSYKLDVFGNTRIKSTSYGGLIVETNDVTTIKLVSNSGSTKNWGFATTNLAVNDFGIYQSTSANGDPINAGSPILYFSGTGAATFSSTVNATSFTASNRTILTTGGVYDNATNGNNSGIGFGSGVLISTDGAGSYSAQNLGNATYPWYSARFVDRVTSLAWTTTGRNFSNEWIEFPNYSGLYSPNNGAHFFPNVSSYGAWKIQGSRNGWNGLEFGELTNGNISLMIALDSTLVGFHNNASAWIFYWSAGELKLSKGTYGGGAHATVLDSVNYTTYLNGAYLPLTGGTLTGTLNGTRGLFSGSTGETLTAQGILGEWTANFRGAASTGNSYGLGVFAGTNASDIAFAVYNQAITLEYFKIKGDGTAFFGSSVTAGGSITIGTAGNYAAGSIYSDGNWGMIFRAKAFSPNYAHFMWATAGDSELMRIAASGNLLINTTTDSGYKLDVQGNASLITINTNGLLLAGGQIISGTGSFAASSSATDVVFNAGGTRLMTLKAGGNVLIGTTTDTGYKLNVNGTSIFSGNIRIENVAGGTALLQLVNNETSPNNNNWSLLAGFGGARQFQIRDNLGGERFSIDGNGNAYFSSSITTGYTIGINGTLNSSYGSIAIDHPGVQTWRIGITNSNTSTFSIGTDAGGLFATKVLNITQSGNVGIGTTNPSGQLSGTKGLSIVDTTNAALGLSNGTNHWLNYLSGTTYAIWNNSVAEVMTLTLVGNVGIGTTSPGAKLDVSGNVTATSFGGRAYPYNSILGAGADASTSTVFAGSTSGYASSIDIAGGGATNPNTIIFKTASVERMRIAANGYVGVGTNDPLAKLHIVGEIRNSFGSGVGGTNYFNIIDGVSNGFKTTITTGNAITYTFHNGANAAVLNIVESGAATFSSSVTATNFIVPGGTSAQFLKADGSLDSSVYLTSTSSTFSYTSSVTLSPTWQNTGVSSTNLGTGAYLVTCYANDWAVGGQYNCTYTGVMYFYAGGTNSSNTNEIVLHHSGHADEGKYIYLRTLSTLNADGKTYLQISSNSTNSGASNYQFTFKKLL